MKYFGTDGFRGEANRTLTAMHAYRIGRFLGYYWKKSGIARPKVAIGKDTRRSSYMLESALTAGLTTSGADVYLLHVTTTPSVSYIVRAEDFHCGIMISASHNPYFDNGIKLMDGNGVKMEESFLSQIEEYMDAAEDYLPLAEREEIGSTLDYVFGRNSYIAYLIQTIRRSFKGKRVGIDCANGASFTIAKHVFDALGADTYVIHDRPDGLNINVNCGSMHIEDLRELVRSQKLDVGFAFDGDADRCIAVDNNGDIMDGDTILYLCGTYLKQNGELLNDTVVTTVMSNLGLHKAFERKQIKTVQTDVGDKYVTAKLLEEGHCLGGEQSGHIIFSKYATTGDGILTALRLMEVSLEQKSDFASLHRDLIIYPQILKNVRVRDKNQVLENPVVSATIRSIDAELGNEGRTLVRPSGTEPLLRIMVEAKQHSQCEEAVQKIVDAIRNEGLLVSAQ